MDINSLQQLRTEIIDRAQALALDGQVNDDDKLAILMNLIRTGVASDRVIREAFASIDRIPDDDTKLSNYFELLYEVDQMIARGAATSETPSDTSRPVDTSQSGSADNQQNNEQQG